MQMSSLPKSRKGSVVKMWLQAGFHSALSNIRKLDAFGYEIIRTKGSNHKYLTAAGH